MSTLYIFEKTLIANQAFSESHNVTYIIMLILNAYVGDRKKLKIRKKLPPLRMELGTSYIPI